jgi:hypothetical protein
MKLRGIVFGLLLTACSPQQNADLTFDGVAPVHLGMTFAEAEKILGFPLRPRGPNDAIECWYTHRTDVPLAKVHYMMKGDVVRRIDVHDPEIKTVAGLGVGASQEKAVAAYGDVLKVELSKYVPPDRGNNLVYDSESGGRRIIFQTQIPDGGTQKTIVSARVGFRPEVDYVEGCS